MVQEAGIKQPQLTSLKGSDLNKGTSFYEIFVFGSYVNVVVKILLVRPLMPVLGRQRHIEIYEFKVNLNSEPVPE